MSEWVVLGIGAVCGVAILWCVFVGLAAVMRSSQVSRMLEDDESADARHFTEGGRHG